jgi:hypothetical protein
MRGLVPLKIAGEVEMKVFFRTMSLLAIAGTVASASTGWCSIPYALRSTMMREYAFSLDRFNFSKGFDATWIQPIESTRITTTDDVSKIIPSDMKPTNDGGLVATQILDRSLSTWFNSDAVRNSSIGHAAHDVEKSMEGDVKFGGKAPDSIKHQLKFSMRATQSTANLEYTGLTTAQVTYFIAQAKTNIELREPVKALGTQVVYNNITTSLENRQTLSLRWDW